METQGTVEARVGVGVSSLRAHGSQQCRSPDTQTMPSLGPWAKCFSTRVTARLNHQSQRRVWTLQGGGQGLTTIGKDRQTFPTNNQRTSASRLYSGHEAGGIQAPCLWGQGEQSSANANG